MTPSFLMPLWGLHAFGILLIPASVLLLQQ
jgi:hypothetical protein